ncbi:hypothetical protein QYE76_032156 [Lolium multiflorum]|uniref:Uncharacterized protein n=1 Tax=Lolium multiflorum TaxID=4521 RepID=A0AAD8QT20_LOLMU|nr:hypothetical protein QYE76_032156 [Lolium multiflorum]
MAHYDETVIARDVPHYLSLTLFDLSRDVEIAPPVFQGRRLYQEHGIEAWAIKTFIPGSDADPDDLDMTYTEVYPDWINSVEIAMQGAIARICHKFRPMIPPTSPYYKFGERTEDGTPVDRTGEEAHSVTRSHLTEREFVSANTELLLKKQVTWIGEAREVLRQSNIRVMQAEAALLAIDDKRLALEERITLLEDPVKLEEKMICSDIWAETIQKTLTLMLENRAAEAKDVEALKKEKDALKKENDALKLENKLLKETVEELTDGKEEEDPQERIMYNSENEVVPIAEGKKRKTSKKTYPLACYGIVKRH